MGLELYGQSIYQGNIPHEILLQDRLPPSSTAIVIKKLGDIPHMSARFMFVTLIKAKQICLKYLVSL
jgi:hypothetical protein